jgi:hypothetical protein
MGIMGGTPMLLTGKMPVLRKRLTTPLRTTRDERRDLRPKRFTLHPSRFTIHRAKRTQFGKEDPPARRGKVGRDPSTDIRER